jgi:hypothetical protein
VPFVRANPNQYLLVGRRGHLENRGSAVQSYLLPGTVSVLVPADKQEASFEFTQETRDGIPLRFKGSVIFRVSEPLLVAQRFNFVKVGLGVAQISELLVHVVLAELRHAVSHMTMAECIEQRKTTLSAVVTGALAETIHREGEDWGITIEVAQVAQVFITDTSLREQLEAEVRNEIRLRSETSDISTAQASQLARMASAEQVAEQQLAADREALRRAESLTSAEMEHERRLDAVRLVTAQQALARETELVASQQAAEEARLNSEVPVLLLKARREAEVAREELAARQAQAGVRGIEVERDLILPRAQQALRAEILPIEQLPTLVDSASRLFAGTNLSIYGDSAVLLGQLAPLLEILGRALRPVMAGEGVESPA